ncbi:J domain-containing protein [Luteimonas soli]|uniref:J domain-containing protein n=1 Tax=Luteimonas soli TaxID=1648966 RepID=A0ABV7XGM1_9GAMM
MGLDFSQLYSLLGLEPGCSLEELKHAYRKRVAELHPDRHSPKSRDDKQSIQLARLIPLYKDAIHFHEQHGRLPGSVVVETPTVPASRGMASSRAFPRKRGTAPETSPIPASHWWLLLGLACLIGYLVLSAFPGKESTPGSSAASGTRPSAAHADTANHGGHAYVLAGMDADTVLSIQGPPSRVSGDVWEYGPSWLRFEDGRLVEWHSSPLYRLRTRTPHSPAGQ